MAGIIVFAAGVRVGIRAPGQAPAGSVRLAVCGGLVAYLVGHVAFGLRMTGSLGYARLAIAAAFLILYAAGAGLSAPAFGAAIAALLVLLCGLERLGWGGGDRTEAAI